MKFKRGQIIKSSHSTFIVLDIIPEDKRRKTQLLQVVPLQSDILPIGEANPFRIAYSGAWEVVSDLSPEATQWTIYYVSKKYFPGQLILYLRTGAIYLLIEEATMERLNPAWKAENGHAFRAYVIYTGRSWAKVGQQLDIFILKRSQYYEVLS